MLYLTGEALKYSVALLKIDWFQPARYGSLAMRLGRAFHLYPGAMSRGRSGRTVVADGVPGLKVSLGQAALVLVENVGLP